jgi:hypothetical protein
MVPGSCGAVAVAPCSMSSPGSTGRSSIPEAARPEPRSRGVLGPPIKSGDDGGGCGKAFPRHHMPEFCSVHCHPQPRGRRECRMLAAPASLACKEKCTLRTQATSGQPKQPALPAQWFTAYTCSPRCAGLLATVALRIITARLDPSIGGSGPHDFAVRLGIARQSMPQRPSLPASNACDDREAPLRIGTGCAKRTIFFRKTEANYFRGEGLT